MKRLAEYLECAYRPETDTLVCRWLREATPTEMRTSYEYLFAEAQGISARRWLLDIRRRNNEDPETAQWLLDHYMPLLTAHFGGPTFLAYLLSPSHLVRIDDAAPHVAHLAQLRRSAHVALFVEEGAANAWLKQQAGC